MAMDDKEQQTAFMSALVTEHFVLQTAASATVNEAGARTSLYVLTLSSSLVAMGFLSRSTDTLLTFAAAVLPALFVLGLFTIVRLVDAGVENLQCLRGIARIRGYYRTLTPDAAVLFSAENGRWPEAPKVPSLWSGSLVAFLHDRRQHDRLHQRHRGGRGCHLARGQPAEREPAGGLR